MKVTIAITGASGVQYGIRLLETLNNLNVETDLILTNSALDLVQIETDYLPEYVHSLATTQYDEMDFRAPIASGSYLTNGMIVIPCSMKTLGNIANGISSNLVARAAEVCLKEKRKLILVPRETPLTLTHLRNMVTAAETGAIILPASPAFYTRPTTIEALIDVVVARILDKLEVEHSVSGRWSD